MAIELQWFEDPWFGPKEEFYMWWRRRAQQEARTWFEFPFG